MISFKGRQFVKPVILTSVRWYIAYSLSYRNIEELMLERGVTVNHSTLNRWFIKYSPGLLSEFKKKKKPFNPVVNPQKLILTKVERTRLALKLSMQKV